MQFVTFVCRILMVRTVEKKLRHTNGYHFIRPVARDITSFFFCFWKKETSIGLYKVFIRAWGALGEGPAHGADLLHRAKNPADGARPTSSQPLAVRQICREPGLLGSWQRAYPRHREHLCREPHLFGECMPPTHGKVFKNTSHFRLQTFSLLNIHSYNVHTQNWCHLVFVRYI
jgi:hypothetical protein